MENIFSKIIVASDIHFGLGKNSQSKMRILKDYVEPQLLKTVNDGENNLFIICGDLFHEMVSVRTDVYREARNFLESVSKNVKTIILAGNHDCFERTTSVTSVEQFDRLENVEVIKYPKERVINGKNCLFLPWSDNNSYAFDFQDEKYDCVFCHPDVPKEFFMGIYVEENSRKMSAAEKERKSEEKSDMGKSGISGFNFSRGTKNDAVVSGIETVKKVVTIAKKGGDIFAGHIHSHSESYILGRVWRFIGSPYQTTSEEMNTRSGFYVISDKRTDFVDISAPEFVKIKFSDIRKKGIENYDFSFIKNNIVQFDGDAILSVEQDCELKKKVRENSPYEISDTDYSNLIVENCVDSGKIGEYQRAFSASPQKCIDVYLESLDEKVFETDGVRRDRIISIFDDMYKNVDAVNGSDISEGGASITYKRLTATNFLSYDTLDFNFEKYKGITLVCGNNLDNPGATNACGKSNIIKAIVYVLFGRFPKKVKKENMVQWGNPKCNTDVAIELSSNGINYRIEAGISKGKDSYHRVFNLDEDKEVTKKSLDETRKFIEAEILHCGFDMFVKTTILTSSEIFNFYGMKKDEKDDYLNTIFGTKTLKEVNEMVKSGLKNLRDDNRKVGELLDSKEHDLEMNRSAGERFENDRNSSVKFMEKKILELEGNLENVSYEELGEKNDRVKELVSERNDTERKIQSLNREISSLEKTEKTLFGQIQKEKASAEILKTEMAKHKNVLPKLCGECKKVAVIGYSLDDYAKKIKKSKEIIENNEALLKKSGKDRAERETERENLIKKYHSLGNDIKNASSESAAVRKIEQEIAAYKSKLDFVKNQKNPNEEIISRLEEESGKLRSEAESILDEIRHYDFILKKAVSQDVITNILISSFVKQLNERIRYYLQRLGLNLGVVFYDDLKYEFVRGDGDIPEFNSLSGGESLRIVIATSFAFKDFLESRRNITSNIRFLDEFFEKDSDNLGINKTLEILKDTSKFLGQNIFMISNKLNEIDSSTFDNILTVTIKDSRSSISENVV